MLLPCDCASVRVGGRKVCTSLCPTRRIFCSEIWTSSHNFILFYFFICFGASSSELQLKVVVVAVERRLLVKVLI